MPISKSAITRRMTHTVEMKQKTALNKWKKNWKWIKHATYLICSDETVKGNLCRAHTILNVMQCTAPAFFNVIHSIDCIKSITIARDLLKTKKSDQSDDGIRKVWVTWLRKSSPQNNTRAQWIKRKSSFTLSSLFIFTRKRSCDAQHYVIIDRHSSIYVALIFLLFIRSIHFAFSKAVKFKINY